MDTFVQLVETRYCRREVVVVLHHNVDRLVGWLLPSSDPPAPHSLLPAARWRRERGKREGVQRANIVWGEGGALCSLQCRVDSTQVMC